MAEEVDGEMDAKYKCERCEERLACVSCERCGTTNEPLMLCHECTTTVHKGRRLSQHAIVSVDAAVNRSELADRLEHMNKILSGLRDKSRLYSETETDIMDSSKAATEYLKEVVGDIRQKLAQRGMAMAKTVTEHCQDKAGVVRECRADVSRMLRTVNELRDDLDQIPDEEGDSPNAALVDLSRKVCELDVWRVTVDSLPDPNVHYAVDFSAVYAEIAKLSITVAEEAPKIYPNRLTENLAADTELVDVESNDRESALGSSLYSYITDGLERDTEMDVMVKSIISKDAQFWIVPELTASLREDLGRLSHDIRRAYMSLDDPLTANMDDDEIVPATICHVCSENQWCRGLVDSIKSPKTKICVRLLDYGFFCDVDSTQIIKFAVHISPLPLQASMCTLLTDPPDRMKNSSDRWLFNDNVDKVPVKCTFIHKTEGEGWSVGIRIPQEDGSYADITTLKNNKSRGANFACRDIRLDSGAIFDKTSKSAVKNAPLQTQDAARSVRSSSDNLSEDNSTQNRRKGRNKKERRRKHGDQGSERGRKDERCQNVNNSNRNWRELGVEYRQLDKTEPMVAGNVYEKANNDEPTASTVPSGDSGTNYAAPPVNLFIECLQGGGSSVWQTESGNVVDGKDAIETAAAEVKGEGQGDSFEHITTDGLEQVAKDESCEFENITNVGRDEDQYYKGEHTSYEEISLDENDVTVIDGQTLSTMEVSGNDAVEVSDFQFGRVLAESSIAHIELSSRNSELIVSSFDDVSLSELDRRQEFAISCEFNVTESAEKLSDKNGTPTSRSEISASSLATDINEGIVNKLLFDSRPSCIGESENLKEAGCETEAGEGAFLVPVSRVGNVVGDVDTRKGCVYDEKQNVMYLENMSNPHERELEEIVEQPKLSELLNEENVSDCCLERKSAATIVDIKTINHSEDGDTRFDGTMCFKTLEEDAVENIDEEGVHKTSENNYVDERNVGIVTMEDSENNEKLPGEGHVIENKKCQMKERIASREISEDLLVCQDESGAQKVQREASSIEQNYTSGDDFVHPVEGHGVAWSADDDIVSVTEVAKMEHESTGIIVNDRGFGENSRNTNNSDCEMSRECVEAENDPGSMVSQRSRQDRRESKTYHTDRNHVKPSQNRPPVILDGLELDKNVERVDYIGDSRRMVEELERTNDPVVGTFGVDNSRDLRISPDFLSSQPPFAFPSQDQQYDTAANAMFDNVELGLPSFPSKPGAQFDILVTKPLQRDGGFIGVHYKTAATQRAMQRFSEQLVYATSSSPLRNPHPNQHAIVTLRSLCLRASIVNFSPTQVQVYLLDHGCMETVGTESLHVLPQHLDRVPYQARIMSLRSRGNKTPRVFDDAQCELFTLITHGTKVVVTLEEVRENVLHVSMLDPRSYSPPVNILQSLGGAPCLPELLPNEIHRNMTMPPPGSSHSSTVRFNPLTPAFVPASQHTPPETMHANHARMTHQFAQYPVMPPFPAMMPMPSGGPLPQTASHFDTRRSEFPTSVAGVPMYDALGMPHHPYIVPRASPQNGAHHSNNNFTHATIAPNISTYQNPAPNPDLGAQKSPITILKRPIDQTCRTVDDCQTLSVSRTYTRSDREESSNPQTLTSSLTSNSTITSPPRTAPGSYCPLSPERPYTLQPDHDSHSDVVSPMSDCSVDWTNLSHQVYSDSEVGGDHGRGINRQMVGNHPPRNSNAAVPSDAFQGNRRGYNTSTRAVPQSYQRDSRRGRQRPVFQCFRCKQFGHVMKFCQEQGGGNLSQSSQRVIMPTCDQNDRSFGMYDSARSHNKRPTQPPTSQHTNGSCHDDAHHGPRGPAFAEPYWDE